MRTNVFNQKALQIMTEGRLSAIILVMLASLPLAIAIGFLRDFHWGYIFYCAQGVVLFVWRTLHDGKPRHRLILGLVGIAIIHLVSLLVFGESLRSFSSFAITLIFLVDYVAFSWLVGNILRFPDSAEESDVNYN